MPLPVYRLRRILAATAIVVTLAVAGMYFYARSRATNVLKTIPGKIGFDIKQTAHGFQFSKSDGKRTLFTVQASDIKEFKLNGNAELHNVSIVLYGRDSSRFDQIYGDDFVFNQKTGDVMARGDVEIDLVANPAGLASPDQSSPKELKNPIHLKTRDLVFNKNTGNAWTDARVELRSPQASGWAVGVKYEGKDNTLTLASQIHIQMEGRADAQIEAERGVITNDPREIVLERARAIREHGKVEADRAAFYLGPDNHVDRVLAEGNVRAEGSGAKAKSSTGASVENAEIRARSDRAEFLLASGEDLLRTATLTGNVQVEQYGAQQIAGTAGRVVIDFLGQNEVHEVHALDGAHLTQKSAPSPPPAGKQPAQQDLDLTADGIDFSVAQGHILQRAVTSGAAQIVISQSADAQSAAQKTTVTAGKFDAEFAEVDGRDRLASIHGAPAARIVNSIPGEPARVSTSDSVDATFSPQGGIEFITQRGNVAYSDGQSPEKRVQAFASAARYTPADQMLILTGSPRLVNGTTATTAGTIRIDRATREAVAEGEVKSTYSNFQEDSNGALLASSSPIHVTAEKMTVHDSPTLAVYTGNARLWQDAKLIEAPSIQFDRDRRFVTALGSASSPVKTTLVQVRRGTQGAKLESAKNAPGALDTLTITSLKLTYGDSERRVHYEGGVVAKGEGFTVSAKTADAYLLPRSGDAKESKSALGQLDRMVAEGNVLVEEPNRWAKGQKLEYTAADDRLVLTGGPPSIFDAEQGRITGVSLTFFRRDDRVLVEGEANAPVVTTTRVAR